MPGPQGPAGPPGFYPPTPAELATKVKRAALDVTLRALVDPRVGVRYLATLTSRVVKLQGGLFLRAIVDTDAATPAQPSPGRSDALSTA
ncbi:hypothetical protein ACI782_14210 [Geodermatophilus sp. SYSU D00703]